MTKRKINFPTQCGFCLQSITDHRIIRQHIEACPLAPAIHPGEKVCLGCWKVKPLSAYGSKKAPKSLDQKTSRCRECHNTQCLLRYHEPHNRLHRRFALKKKHYGVDEAAYNALLKAQGGGCAICRRVPEPGNPKTDHLTVDHDHHGKKLSRGLLCAYCNAGLGGFDDDIERIKVAIRYLEKWRSRHANPAVLPSQVVAHR